MIDRIGEFVRRAFPGFPGRYVTRIGEITAVHDYPGLSDPGQPQASDRYRPRLAVDVQPLTPGGKADPSRPVLRGLALPHAWAQGFPEIGTRVRLGYDYGDPTHPYIGDVLSEGRELPPITPRERHMDLGEGAFIRRDPAGNIRIQTDGTLILDAARVEVIAEALAETLGEASRTVERDETVSIEGSRAVQVLGAEALSVGGDARRAVAGSLDTTIGGDEGRLIGGKLEVSAQLGAKIIANLGPAILESKTLEAKLQGVTVRVGSLTVDLLAIVDAVLTALGLETHTETGSVTSVPINAVDYATQKTQLGLIKGV